MSLSKYCRNIFKATLVAVTISLFFFTSASSAYAVSQLSTISKTLPVTAGGFDYERTKNIYADARVGAATVQLPPGETGTIELIKIVGPDNEVEFQCTDIDVSNGVDIISACGGPAYLAAGPTTYEAMGRNFGPDEDVAFKINLDIS